jgi:hypothetical protein
MSTFDNCPLDFLEKMLKSPIARKFNSFQEKLKGAIFWWFVASVDMILMKRVHEGL